MQIAACLQAVYLKTCGTVNNRQRIKGSQAYIYTYIHIFLNSMYE